MNLFHDLLKQYNFTLVTSAVVSNENADLKTLIARLLVSIKFVFNKNRALETLRYH